jgi:hypothetical protein
LPHQEYDIQQRKWLREQIVASNAVWKMVITHHPYLNNGGHGNAGQFDGSSEVLQSGKEFKKMVEEEICKKVDFLLSGHDHNLQWLKAHPECGNRPQFLISGAGAKTDARSVKQRNPAEWQEYGLLGFFWMEATHTQINIIAYTLDKHGKPEAQFEKAVPR